jgi:hypothetical protein
MVERLKSSQRHLGAQQAKEFLISEVVEEARMENVPLSEVERKMLFFTETDETLPDMTDVNEQFERGYDSSRYEEKIARLLHNAFKRICLESPDGEKRWKQAIADLRQEDHYLLVMVDQASRSVRPPGDQLKLWGTGFAVVLVLVGIVFFATKYNIDLDEYFPSRSTLFVVMWVAGVALILAYVALRFFLGQRRIDRLFVRAIERLFAPSGREK